jgi:hypothetical protein
MIRIRRIPREGKIIRRNNDIARGKVIRFQRTKEYIYGDVHLRLILNNGVAEGGAMSHVGSRYPDNIRELLMVN